MSESADPAAARRRIVRREALTWLSAFGWPALRVLVFGTALGIATVVVIWQMAEPEGDPAPTDEVIRMGLAYGVALALGPALWAGLSSLAFRVARGWAVVPALAVPACVFGSLYLHQGVLRSRADELVHAVNERLDERGLMMLTDTFATAPHMPGLTEVPQLMADAGDSFFDEPVRAALDALWAELGSALTLGLVPGALISLVALSIGYRRGWARRHEADLERLQERATSRQE